MNGPERDTRTTIEITLAERRRHWRNLRLTDEQRRQRLAETNSRLANLWHDVREHRVTDGKALS